jgi:hypothetical protein
MMEEWLPSEMPSSRGYRRKPKICGLWTAKENNMSSNVYIENGYKNRSDYLESLADEYGVPLVVVSSLADMLGPNEDFDGLVSNLEDYYESGLLDVLAGV